MARNGTEKAASLKPNILVVNHDPQKLQSLQQTLSQSYQVHTASTGLEAIQLLNNIKRIDALVVDLSLPNMEGGVLIRYVNEMVSKSDNIIKMLIGESKDQQVSFVGTYGGTVDYFYNHSFDPDEVRRKLSYLIAHKSKEKRKIMRASVLPDQDVCVDIGLNGVAPVENISEEGMFIKTLLPKDKVLPFTLNLPDGTQHTLAGHVVHTDEKSGGVGVRFMDMDDKSRMILSRFISECVSLKDLSGLKNRYSFLHVDRMVPFTDKNKIEALISYAHTSKTEITAIPSKSRLPVQLALKDIEPWHYCHFSGEKLDTVFKTSDSVFISFQNGDATYTFETVIYRISTDGSRIKTLYPQILFYSNKRSIKRNQPDEEMELEIVLPSPFETTIRGTISDISEGGVSFITDSKEVALLAGTPVESLKIFKGENLVREARGEIRNIVKIDEDGEGRIRYGIQFGIGRLSIETSELPVFESRKARARIKDTDYSRIGPRRQSDLSELAKRPPTVIRMENRQGEEIVGLLDFSFSPDNDPIPVVLIPPAFGKTKETLFALSQTIIENFYTRGKPIAVLRYDGIRRKGESHKDPEASHPPYEMVNASLSQGAADIKAVLDWIETNPNLKASAVLLVTFSLAALEARLVLRDSQYRKKINYWISCMGTPELRHLLTRVNCGLDLLEQYQLGIKLGVRPVLGNLVNVDKYMEDGLENAIATLDQAREDMPLIDIPITWLYGEHDHWVKQDFIRDIMGIRADASREVISMSLGHNARTSKDALQMFCAVTSLAHRYLFNDSITPAVPTKDNLDFKRHTEKDRIPKRGLKNRDEYWRRYLIGEQELLGFDVLTLADDYSQLMHDQVWALDLSTKDRLLDLGGGTGNFITHLMEFDHPVPQHITIADIVPEALNQALHKLENTSRKFKISSRINAICCDVEMNRYLILKRFLAGEISSFRELVDKIENLTVQTASIIQEKYSPRLHRILRGEHLTPQLQEWLKNTFEFQEIRTITDFNMASRYVQGLENEPPQYKQLIFPDRLDINLRLPFKTGYFNKILMSLVLSYIFNPLQTLIELKRILRPGGFLVISSLRPDADASGLFTRLVEKVENTPDKGLPKGWDKQLVLSSIRSFLNDAQALVELEEAGTFDFFDPDELKDLLEEAGFHILRTIETFGNPAQGYICVATTGSENG